MVSIATHNGFGNGGMPTKLLISAVAYPRLQNVIPNTINRCFGAELGLFFIILFDLGFH